MKRSAGLRRLSQEHHTALVLVQRIARAEADNATLLATLPAIFADELEPHFRVEEDELLPRLAVAGATALVDRTLAEHRQLRDLAARIADGDGASLKAFGLLLQAHVRFEERELFAAAQALLPDDFPAGHGARRDAAGGREPPRLCHVKA